MKNSKPLSKGKGTKRSKVTGKLVISAPSRGGYALKKDKKPKVKTDSTDSAPRVAKQGIPIPPNIKQALQAMSALAIELRQDLTKPFSVGIEPYQTEDSEWVWRLVVRGEKPTLSVIYTPDFYQGHRVRWSNSVLVKAQGQGQ